MPLRKKWGSEKVGFGVSSGKEGQKEGISRSFLFQVKSVILKHTADSKREPRNPTFFHILLGHPGQGDGDEAGRTSGGTQPHRASSPTCVTIVLKWLCL